MITLCIRYTIDVHKHSDFEQYARNWPEPIRRCGGELVGYFLPTKIAGPTNFAVALINFPDLATYGKYRDALMRDPAAKANVELAETVGVHFAGGSHDSSASLLNLELSAISQIFASNRAAFFSDCRLAKKSFQAFSPLSF